MKRHISLVLAVWMLLSAIITSPISAHATAGETTAETTVETTTETTVETTTDQTQPEETQPEETQPEETQPEETQPEETRLTISDSCMEILKLEEGFSKYPYWDYSQWTVGHGTRCPDDKLEQYKKYGITPEEAQDLLMEHLAKVEEDLHKRIIDKHGLELTQNQFDALLLFSYNVGTGWTYDSGSNIYKAVVNGWTGNDLIRALGLWCRAGGKVRGYLLRRRLSEANMYLNGLYSQTPPDNYCYILYDGNGGSISNTSQCYDSNTPVELKGVANYEGYNFQGWFTKPEGGTKVTVLDETTKNITVYAQWLDDEGKTPEENAYEKVTLVVKVTASSLSVRGGPGTNFSRLGYVYKGDQLNITLLGINDSDEYMWGYSEELNGWIAMDYTELVGVEEHPDDTQPEETEPEETQPEETEPEETEPEETEPEETEPEETEPEETEPEETEPEQTQPQEPAGIMGTVKVSDFLCVRKGPGTGYEVVEKLYNGDRVKILEQKTVGSMIWGRVANGWVSLKYVTLDEQPQPQPPVEDKPAVTTLKGTIKAIGGLRIRTGPGVGYEVAGTYANGSAVEILEQKTVDSTTWGRTAKGWISMNYVVLEQQSSGNTGSTGGNAGSTGGETVAPQKITGTVKVDTNLRVRSGPGSSYTVCAYLKNGQKVEILEQKTVSGVLWGRVEQGWVSMAYIVLDKTQETTKVTKTITADCLRIRSSASTSSSVAGYLYYGDKVEILETKTVGGILWGRVAKGWISMQYTK